MSLCSLIYNYKQWINYSVNDFESIMDNGSQLYSRLSQLTRRSFLVHKELTTFLKKVRSSQSCSQDWLWPQYSESCIGTIHQETTKDGYQCCISLDRAFQSLISENFNNFVFTIGCTADVVKVMWAWKYSILMQGIFMVDAMLKVHVCCFKCYHWIA